MSDAPTWYDLLDVSREASAEDIRAAWRTQIADLEPGDRRFDALNRAAKVLLDPEARAAYDAGLPQGDDTDPTDGEESGLVTGAGAPSSTGSGAGVPSWLLAGLGVLAAGLVVATIWMWAAREDGGDDSAARDAQVAAERAVVPVLSYDYEHLEADQKAAQALMTGNYREEYDKLFTLLEENAPQTQTKVTASVIASGIVRASEER